jgi:hypothetical protein
MFGNPEYFDFEVILIEIMYIISDMGAISYINITLVIVNAIIFQLIFELST